LLAAHEFMMNGLVSEAGRYRSGGVGIFRGEQWVNTAPPADRVPKLMAKLLNWLENAGEPGRTDSMKAPGRSHRPTLRENHLNPALEKATGSNGLAPTSDGARPSFTGHTVFTGGTLLYIAESGSVGDYINSILSLNTRKIPEIYPGHGDLSTNPEADMEKAV
jgi:hypothetical protein